MVAYRFSIKPIHWIFYELPLALLALLDPSGSLQQIQHFAMVPMALIEIDAPWRS
jgi:hypothetical protein